MPRSPVDRDGSAVDPFNLLRSWRVLGLPGNSVPADADGYRLDRLIGIHSGPTMHSVCMGLPMKRPDTPWAFGVSSNQPLEAQVEVAKDAVRVVTGHRHAFPLAHQEGWTTLRRHPHVSVGVSDQPASR